jgi:hypothetical protein
MLALKSNLRNIIINGGMDYWQRDITFAVAGYTADRWQSLAAQAVDRTVESGEAFKYALQSASTATINQIEQRIESIFTKDLVGKKVTISATAKLTSGTMDWKLIVKSADVVDDFSATTLAYALDLDNEVLDAAYKIFNKTFIVTQTMADNGFSIAIGDDASVTSTFKISNIMIHEGDVPQPFQTAGRNFQDELTFCQRYFEKSYALDVVPGTIGRINSIIYAYSGGAAGSWLYTEKKRVIPIITSYNPDTGASPYGTISQEGENGFTVSAGTTSIVIHYTADAEL